MDFGFFVLKGKNDVCLSYFNFKMNLHSLASGHKAIKTAFIIKSWFYDDLKIWVFIKSWFYDFFHKIMILWFFFIKSWFYDARIENQHLNIVLSIQKQFYFKLLKHWIKVTAFTTKISHFLPFFPAGPAVCFPKWIC